VMLDKSAQAGTHTHAERGDDCYSTPPCAVEALLRVEDIPRDAQVWEPACGTGNIARTLQLNGYRNVWSTDLVDHGFGHGGYNFLADRGQDEFYANVIVTNPPYRLAEQFVTKAVKICPWVIMLLRLAFLESEKRSFILERAGLARVHVFRNRLPMMHRKDWDGPKASSAMPFAWFVWQRGHKGPPTLNRISWEK
jgi:hypothetical protein